MNEHSHSLPHSTPVTEKATERRLLDGLHLDAFFILVYTIAGLIFVFVCVCVCLPYLSSVISTYVCSDTMAVCAAIAKIKVEATTKPH